MEQKNALIRLITIIGVGIALIVLFSSSIFLTLKPGEKGILFKRFSGGLEMEQLYNQGFHVIAPWNRMIKYNVREQEVEETLDVLSSNGLSISVDISARFHPTYNKLAYLHDEFGDGYRTSLVVPESRSAVREVIGRYTPEELYSTKRGEVQKAIFDELNKTLTSNHVTLKALLIRSVQLPTTIQTAIEKKLKQEQESLEYKFKLIKERSEAERKKIEAEGVKVFQETVNQGLTANYLKWKGIEATLELANSTNAKTVIIGSGKDGLPLILGNQ